MDDDGIRQYLHSLLLSTFPDLAKIYYMPSGNIMLEYPCIVYEAKATEPAYAGNAVYSAGTRFQVSILSNLPGYSNKRKMFDLPRVVVTRNTTFIQSDIVHDVFTVSVNTI